MIIDVSLKKKALRQLACTEGEISQNALNKEMTRIITTFQTETQYDQLESSLDLLDAFSYRVPTSAVQAIDSLLIRLGSISLTYPDASDFPTEKLMQYQTAGKLIAKALAVLERIRYHVPERALDLFFKYSINADEAVSKQAMHSVTEFARFDLDIFYGDGKNWKGLGWGPQEKALEKIESFSDGEQRQYLSAIIEVCNRILSPSIEGTTSNYRSITIRTGPVPAIDGVRKIRNRALKTLENLYCQADSVEEKKRVLSAMESATRTPHQGNYGDDLLGMIQSDTASILRFIKKIVDKEDLQILQRVERDTYFLFRRNDNAEVRGLCLEIKDSLERHEEYQIFRVLIGFESVFHDWLQSGENNYQQERKIREEAGAEFARSITESNYIKWQSRILRYASINSNDLATFPYFGRFLELFGESSPTLALRLLDESRDTLRGFIIPLMLGVWKAGKQDEIKERMMIWLRGREKLIEVARFLQFATPLDRGVLGAVAEIGRATENANVLTQVVATVAARYERGDKQLIKALLVPVLESLTALKNVDWIHEFWFRSNQSELISDLESADEQVVLRNLLHAQSIDYEEESVIGKIAEKSPEAVINFFCQRISVEKTAGVSAKYDAVPFDFDELSRPLAKAPKIAVDIVRQTYDGDYGMFIYRGARLLKNIFPDFPQPFADELIRLIRVGGENDLLFVLAVLRNYQGQLFLHEVCKELVKVLPGGGSLETEVRITLESTGVVSGEYGFADAYSKKIEEVKPWLDDADLRVSAFAKRYLEGLEKQIVYERQRADEQIALRKYQYGDADGD